MKILDLGGGIEGRAIREYPNASITLLDIKYGFDVRKHELPLKDWDIILVNHLIEHLDDPDDFIRSCKKVMSPCTILEISTPNLCAWFNRIIFLFGWLPHSYELSYEYNVGKCFGWNKEGIGGHLRIFTVRAMVELLTKHGFKVMSIKGEPSSYTCSWWLKLVDRILCHRPSLASTFRIKCSL